jgi:prophage DNA circulation protein
MARNWLRAFRKASFRGVTFHVDNEGAAGARRLSVSPIAYADQSVIEDMGRDPREMPVRAYVSGDVADATALALISALEQKGPALLVLPMQPPLRARVFSWSMDREKDQSGYVGFDISFLEEGQSSVAFGGSNIGRFGDLMALGALLLSTSLSSRPRGNRQIEANSVAVAVNRVTSVAAMLSADAESSREVRDAFGALNGVAASVDIRSDAFGKAIVDVWRSVALFADPADALTLISSEIGATPATNAERSEVAAMLAAAAVVSARAEYPSRQDASEARAVIARAASIVLPEIATMGADVLDWLAGLTGEAAIALSRNDADRSPLIRAETGISISAIHAAYQLYGDAGRAQEIIDRNGIATAALMPAAFEAVAP